ncbi:MAG: mechanosensitive ion channel [Hyphomicrobiaceae bacterium]
MEGNGPAVDWFGRLLRLTGSIELSILLLIALTLAAAMLMHAVAYGLLRRVLEHDGLGYGIAERIRHPTLLAVGLLALAVVLPAAVFEPTIAEIMRRALKIGVAVLMGWTAILATNVAADRIEQTHRIDVEDNLAARRLRTQVKILRRMSQMVVLLLTAGGVLVTFPTVQTYGVSLFASAGVAGLILGFAARPLLTSLIAGVQIALTQPIRIDDVVIVEGEWGWVEEINATYVVVRIWDLRRLIVPLSHFIEKPFENWTRESAAIIGAVVWHLDYRAPIGAIRDKLKEIVAEQPEWDGNVANLQVVESCATTITVRALVSAGSSSKAWTLRCAVREAMITWIQSVHPDALPRVRAIVEPRGSLAERTFSH